jgi:hypothetical protein
MHSSTEPFLSFVASKSGTRARFVGIYSDTDHCVGVVDHVILTYSAQAPNPAYLEAWTRAMDGLVQRLGEPIVVITVISHLARAPDEQCKKVIRAIIGAHRAHIGAFAYVVEGHGFGAAAMRSALSLISLAARYPFPQKVFANMSDAAPWAIRSTPGLVQSSVTCDGLVGVVGMMRGQVDCLAAAG